MSGTAQELIAAMPEKVWSIEASKSEIDSYIKAYKTSNIKAVQGGAELRLLSENPPAPNAVLETPTMEDVFLYYFGETAGEADD